jgi:hypothetical protein
MKLYVGNCQSKFDCDLLIQQVQNQKVSPFYGFMELDKDHQNYNDIHSQKLALEQAGYTDQSVEYYHYQSGTHFDSTYTQWLGEIVGCTPLMCWISEIRPGKCTPWHWDVNPWEDEHKKQGKIVRYFAFLSKPQPGHIFVTEQDAYYNEPQGAIYQYSDIHAFHAGSNVGLTPKYLLTLTGVQ